MRRADQKIILVTGKGGVGKSSVAAALALHQSRLGQRVLLVELGERSFLQYVFPNYGGQGPVEVTSHLLVDRWTGSRCLREYLVYLFKIERLADLFFENPVMQSFVNVAPGLRELAILGKVTSGVRGVGPDLDYDVVVVDGYATGHFEALLQAPLGMAEAIRLGPMGEQSRSIVEVLLQPQTTKTVVVSLAEELPVSESLELKEFLDLYGMAQPTLILNKNLSLPLSEKEILAVVDGLRAMPEPPVGLVDFSEYLISQGRRQEESAARLKQGFSHLISLPFYLTSEWTDLIRTMSHDLEQLWPSG